MKRRLLVLLVLTLALLGIPAVTGAQGSTSDYAQFSITDITGMDVVSDGRGWYRDYRLTSPVGDPCVKTYASSKWGYTELWPQRPNCTTQQPRIIRYYLPTEIAGLFTGCAIRENPGPDGVNDSGDERFYVEDVKRMVSETLFLKSALTNGADLRFGFYCGGSGLSIQMDGNVPVQKLTDTTRRVTNLGDGAVRASLYYIVDSTAYPYPGAPTGFPFNFEITIEQVPASKTPRR